MSGFNRVTLIGNLTRDPQTKILPTQAQVTEFGLAVNRRFKTQSGEDREETCFLDCAAFGKPGETIAKFCQKGKQLFIEGRLKYDTWDDKQGGGKRSKVSVIVENFQFLGARDDSRFTHLLDNRPAPQPRPLGAPATDAPVYVEADIPF